MSKYKIIRVTPELLFKIIYGKEIKARRVSELPDDLKFVRCFLDQSRHGEICLVVESESFDEVLIGETIPDLEPPKYEDIE